MIALSFLIDHTLFVHTKIWLLGFFGEPSGPFGTPTGAKSAIPAVLEGKEYTNMQLQVLM